MFEMEQQGDLSLLTTNIFSAILDAGSSMPFARETTQIPYSLGNNEIVAPEIFPAKGGVRVLIPHDPELAHYNAAVIKSIKNPSESLILLREVPTAGVKAGTPDKGNLLIYRSTPEKVERVAQLDLSDPAVSNWEDARAFVSHDFNLEDQRDDCEGVLIGLTAIRANDNKPVAATVRGKVLNGEFLLDQESLAVFKDDQGKNVTPISLNRSLFRREGERHSLEVIEYDMDENGHNKLKVRQIIQFPKKSWCEWQIGTQAQFLPEGILPIHGVNKFNLGIDPKTGEEVDGYAYSMGLAQLDEELNVIKISDTPLFNRESFKNILPMGIELDTNKDVIYCCGYSVEEDTIKFVVNIGDLMTVEVSKNMSELRSILAKSSPNALEKVPKAA